MRPSPLKVVDCTVSAPTWRKWGIGEHVLSPTPPEVCLQQTFVAGSGISGESPEAAAARARAQYFAKLQHWREHHSEQRFNSRSNT